MTWQGEDQYKTSMGASISWIIVFIMLAYTAFRGYYLVNRLSPGIAKTSLIRPPEDDIAFKPQETGFDFAFGLGKPLDPTLGHFSVKYIQQSVESGERIKNRTNLNFTQCGD